MAELTIMTASSCLMGKEIRAQLDETVAQLYHDLDQGFGPLNFLFPNLPLPSYKRRDVAHIKMRELFMSIMQERRASGNVENSDMLQTFMDSEYRDGRKMTDREVAHMMIATLMAGQHTSNTTSTWCLAYLAGHPEIL
jgi:sterol 14-demethylase